MFFPNGSVVLSGDIGSGKSTILIALEFALFGFQSKRLSGSHLLRKGESAGEVEVGLIIDGKDYIIKRKLKETKTGITQSSGSINDGGMIEDFTTTEMKARIFEKLGYPKDHLTKSKNYIYRYTVYTPQEELKQILYENEENRIESIRNIFQIDKYKNVQQNISIVVKKLKDKSLELKGRLHNIEDIKNRVDSLKRTLESSKKIYYIEQQKNEKIKENLSNVLKEIEKVNQMEEELKRINFDIEQLFSDKRNSEQKYSQHKNRINEIEEKLRELETKELSITVKNIDLDENKIVEEIYQLQEKILEIRKKKDGDFNKRKELVELNKELNELIEMKQSNRIKIDNNRVKILKYDNLLKEKHLIESKIEKEKALFDKINEEVIKSKTEHHRLQETTSSIMQLKNCPTCLQEVNIEHKKSINAKNNQKVIALKNSLVDLENKKSQCNMQLKNYQIELNNFESVRTEYHTLSRENELLAERSKQFEVNELKLTEKINKIKSEIDVNENHDNSSLTRMQSELQDKKLILETIKKNNENITKKKHLREIIELNSRQLNEIVKENSELEIKIKTVAEKIRDREEIRNQKIGEKSKYSNLPGEKNEIERELAQSNQVLISTNRDIENAVNNIESTNHELNNLSLQKKQLESVQKTIEFLNTDFANLTSNIEKHLFTTIQLYFDEYFSHWFSILIDDNNLTSKINENFSPVILQNGHETDFSNLSGGEKTAICLAYRLALNKVINNLVSNIKTKNLIILDEPTDGFSTSQMDKIRDVLDELNLEQVLIVSHESKIESFVDHVIGIEKQNHISNIIQ